MKTIFIKYLVSFVVFSTFLLPNNIFAACSSDGYTIVYVNGINTKSEKDTQNDTQLLMTEFIKKSNLKDIQFLPGYNPSHIGGVGDIAETISQIYNNPISNYDLNNLLLRIYPEVTTRKILLVGHSQGTFYTNELYNYLVNHGVPKESIGVYNVATPASSVGGYESVPEKGAYITSSNDKVINLVRNLASKLNAKQPLPANTNIPLTTQESADLFGGHSFSGVYLANESLRIVSEIETALKKLSVPSSAEITNAADAGCFIPPEKNIAYYIQKSVFPSIDSTIDGVVATSEDVDTIGTAISDSVSKVIAQVTNTAKDIVSNVTDNIKNNAQVSNEKLLANVSLSENNDTVKSGEFGPITPESDTQSMQNDSAVVITGDSSKSNETDEPYIDKSKAEETDVSLKTKEVLAPEQNIATSTEKNKLTDTKITLDVAPMRNFQTCSFSTTKTANHQNLIINEVAWMGSQKSSSDEWIELKNISGAVLDISNWQILDKGEQIKITIPANTKISAGGFLLMERTDDNSVPNVKADIIYTGSLSNSDEGIRLFDDQCNLIDEVLANSEWPAGDATAKRTMERQADLTWSTYSGNGEGSGDSLILGTPKKENSVKIVSYGGGGGGGSGAPANNQQPATNDQQQTPAKILITEVQITGGTGKSNDDFIELYNPNNTRVNLKGYRLVKRTKTGTTDTSIKSWTDDAYIESKGYYLWANSDYKDISVLPNITTSATLANDNGVALRFGAEDIGTIIDSVGWGAAENVFIGAGVFSQNPGAGQSIQRKIQNNEFIDTDNNASDFELTGCPNPGVQSKSCAVSGASESNQAPSAFFDFSITTPKTGEEIIFNAASSTDPDGGIVLYDWNFGDGQLASTTQAATTHSYSLAGNFNVSLTVFDNLNASSTYVLPLSVASSSVQEDNLNQQASSMQTGHVLISEIMPGLGTGRSDEEFVEFYNPTSADISLTGYSLKRRPSVLGTTTQTLVNSTNFASTTIKADSFLLIASKEYQGSSTPDIFYSYTSYHLDYDDDAVVLYNASSTIVDEVDYANIESGKSLERKALSDNVCVSAQGSGEFLGNGCDTGNFSAEGGPASSWEIRDIPHPQNSLSFPEPRNKPTSVKNFSAQYDKPNKKIILSWDASSDYSGAALADSGQATSTLTYLISDISDNPLLGSIMTSSTTAEFNISEVGRDYVFGIKAVDKEGLSSDILTTTISVSGTSIEDVNYFLLNQNNLLSSSENPGGQVFKPLATGVLSTITLNVVGSVNYGDLRGDGSVNVALYEWNNDASSTGALLATSSTQGFYANNTGDYTWGFDQQNQIILDSSKYYYLQINFVRTHGDLHMYWGMSNAPDASVKSLYVIIKAAQNGVVNLSSPINNYVYENTSINLQGDYLEPENNKYSAINVEIKDFYTNETVNNFTIDLTSDQKTIGWHTITGNLGINHPGYFKIKVSLSDSIKSENNFSIFGAEPDAGTLLSQKKFDIEAVRSDWFSGQVFRPAASGNIDSLTLRVSSTDPNVVQGHSYWSIYEWNGNGNDSSGSAGALLATTTSKFLVAATYPSPVEETWNLPDDNKIFLDSNKYYYLTLSIASDSPDCTFDCRPAMLFLSKSNNGSLIDGRLIGQYINQGDLYLVINKKSD
jgi:hypothetical protein